MSRRAALFKNACRLIVALQLVPDLVIAQDLANAAISRDSMTTFATGGWGLALNDRDPAVKPGDNFYMSQNGGWFARSELDSRNPSRAYWRDLQRLAPRRAMALLKEAAG